MAEREKIVVCIFESYTRNKMVTSFAALHQPVLIPILIGIVENASYSSFVRSDASVECKNYYELAYNAESCLMRQIPFSGYRV